jgi:hypothetical protein
VKEKLFASQYLLDSGEVVGLEEYRAAPGRKEGPHLLPLNFFFLLIFFGSQECTSHSFSYVAHL